MPHHHGQNVMMQLAYGLVNRWYWMPGWLHHPHGIGSPAADPAGQPPPPAAELGRKIAGWLGVSIRCALEILEEDNIRLSGILFNDYTERRYLMGENYSYGYYKASRYGHHYRYSYDSYGACGFSGA